MVNEEEAERVRAIFALFEENGSARLTLAEIERRGWRLKSWTRKTGEFRAGGPFTMTRLRRLLTNILYTGEIRHKGQTYPGEHAAIVAPEVWQRVQELIARAEILPRGSPRNKHLALLSGLLHCESCAARMVYSYAVKNGRKYPYYVCLGRNAAAGRHVPASRSRRRRSRNRCYSGLGRRASRCPTQPLGRKWNVSIRWRRFKAPSSESAMTGTHGRS